MCSHRAAGTAQHSGDGAAPVGEGERVVARLGCLECPVGQGPRERAYAQINAALLAALTAQRLAESGDRRAEMWGCAIKAYAIDAAHAAASDLTPLAGAAGCAVGSPLEKASGDLRALMYADGIHDSLYRAAGRALTTPASVPRPQESACRAASFQ